MSASKNKSLLILPLLVVMNGFLLSIISFFFPRIFVPFGLLLAYYSFVISYSVKLKIMSKDLVVLFTTLFSCVSGSLFIWIACYFGLNNWFICDSFRGLKAQILLNFGIPFLGTIALWLYWRLPVIIKFHRS